MCVLFASLAFVFFNLYLFWNTTHALMSNLSLCQKDHIIQKMKEIDETCLCNEITPKNPAEARRWDKTRRDWKKQ